jgi:hypothetical protein
MVLLDKVFFFLKKEINQHSGLRTAIFYYLYTSYGTRVEFGCSYMEIKVALLMINDRILQHDYAQLLPAVR